MTTNPTAKAARQAAEPRGPGLRQTMSDLHIWAGLLVGWILYAMFLTGTVSYFREEISAWMRPELPVASPLPAAEAAQRTVDALAREAADSPQWGITLPTPRNGTASAYWLSVQGRGYETGVFDPRSGTRLAARETQGGDFFYGFHFNLHYVPILWGRWIAGLCAMFMLVAIVSGVITHKKIFADFFTFRWGKGQRAWLDAHSGLSVLGLPFHFMITYTGLVTLMTLYMPWGALTALPTPQARQAAMAEQSAYIPPGPRSDVRVPLVPVGAMVREAEQRWGAGEAGRLLVNNAGGDNARVLVVRSEGRRVSSSPQYLVFDGTSGALLQDKTVTGAAGQTRGVLYALHLGRFADTVTRWFYFLVSLAGTAMVGTGLVLWTVKRRQKLADPTRPYLGFRVVERLNIAAIAGLSVAMAAFLWGNRLLPSGLAERANSEINLFFAVWAVTLLYACVRPAKRAWVELLALAALLLAALPVFDALTTSRGLPASLMAGDWVFAGFDLTLLAFAALHAWLAIRTARHQPKTRPAPRRARHAAGQVPAQPAAGAASGLATGE
ncbi:MAG: hypothetical protein GAK30_00597 [Paracidovorax wautersii]|uniref:Iron-regulated membrane protein n=1 Tax=Paracidovorax wautersii TaxID=1177982 RepID=A0A7V8FRL8_9BURK|nr:MAG: hypothetical protein GAK30_00597 [Paracidovorax wautersii]